METDTPNMQAFFVGQGRIIDMDALKSLAGGDEQFIGQLLQLFQRKAPETLGSVEDALKARDYEALRYHVHSFKSTVSIFGNAQLSNLVSTIERMAMDKARWVMLEERLTLLRSVSELLMKEVAEDLQMVQAA